MICALTVSHIDAIAATRWLSWCSFLCAEPGGAANHRLVVFCSKRVEKDRARLSDMKQASTGPGTPAASFIVCPDEDERGWPGSATHMFIRCLEHCGEAYPNDPVMFCEPDTVPMVPGWFNGIEKEYAEAKKPFMGQLIISSCTHMTGCAVYPTNWRELCPMLDRILDEQANRKDKGLAWDAHCGIEIVPQMHDSKTIQQIWRPGLWKEPSKLEKISKACMLFHQDKEGTLIKLLNEQRYQGRFNWKDRIFADSCFLLESNKDFVVVDDHRIQFKKACRGPAGYFSILNVEDVVDFHILASMIGRCGVSKISKSEYTQLSRQTMRF